MTVASAGIQDDVFFRRLRNFMEDPPLFTPEQVSPNGQSTEYRCSQFPIYDDPTTLSVTVGGVNQVLTGPSHTVFNGVGLTTNQISIDWETGWIFWGIAPPQGTNSIQIRKYKVRWRDEKLSEALYAGLQEMFPRVWQKAVDTSITLAVNQWDYQLPTVFSDPRVTITKIEAQLTPYALERFRVMDGWRRIGNLTLQVPAANAFPPGTTLRISYCGPYQYLADLEPQLQQAPLWYAKGYLLTNKEIVRVRQDTANVTQQETANPVGSSQNAGQFFLRKFDEFMNSVKRPMPMPNVQVSYTVR